jgi:hydroxymethylbilane synthase
VPTKTTCRIGSDVDLLSRVQLDSVLSQLRDYGAKHSIDFVAPGDPSLRGSKYVPNSPARLATLMSTLLDGEYDALVLDAVNLPSRIPTGLTIGAITSRITPYDALISNKEWILDELPENAVLAANTPSREAQMLYYRPDLRIVHAKGSLDSLIQKVRGASIDAAVVAAADMESMGKQEYVVELLTNSVCIPTPGQGALAVLIRSSEETFRESVQSINDPRTYSALRAEWAFMDHLGANGRAPVGVLGSIEGKALELEGVLAYPDGREKIHFMVKGVLGQEEDLGKTLAHEILEAGGREILQELHVW